MVLLILGIESGILYLRATAIGAVGKPSEGHKMTIYHLSIELDPDVKQWTGKALTSVGVAHVTPWCDNRDQAQQMIESWLDYRLNSEPSFLTHRPGVSVDGNS